MKEIHLTKGQRTLIDDEDHKWLNQYKWFARKGSNGVGYYAIRSSKRINGKQFDIRMHRIIMQLKRGDSKEVDHINGNGLDNRRSNLRTCTRQQNQFNSRPRIGTSKYKGVTWFEINGKYGKWCAKIRKSGKTTHLGYFKDEIEAAKAYDAKAKILFGEFARPNFGGALLAH